MQNDKVFNNNLNELKKIVAVLRGPKGCPWDKAQTHKSLAPYVIEESHELAEVLDEINSTPLHPYKLMDELSDVLFQVYLHAQIAEERGLFSIEDVYTHLNEKLIRRHPHVFSNTEVSGIDEVWQNWEKIKSQELNSESKSYFNYPKSLPALQLASKIGSKTERLKFDWRNANQVRTQLDEELKELDIEISKSENTNKISDELGDVLFTLAQLARHLDFDPEQALRKSNRKFIDRFNLMLDLVNKDNLDWKLLSDDQKEIYWNLAKTKLNS